MLMQHPMRTILLTLPRDLEEEHIRREVFVFPVSKRLRENDSIRKAYHALMRTLENNNCGLEEEDEEDMDLFDMNVENGEDVVDENVIESKLIGSSLFCIHLEKL